MTPTDVLFCSPSCGRVVDVFSFVLLKNRLCSRTHIAILVMKYVLETCLRTCIQRGIDWPCVPIFTFLHKSTEILRIPCLTLIRNRPNSESCVLGPKNAPRSSKSTTFAKVLFSAIQPSEILSQSNMGIFGFTNPTSDTPMRPS